MKKKFFISTIIIFLIILSAIIFIKFYFTDAKIKSIIETQVYYKTGNILKIDNLKLSLTNGLNIELNNLKYFNKDKKQEILNIRSGEINLQLIPLFAKKIVIDKLSIISGQLHYNFTPLFKKSSKSASKKNFQILAKNISIKNFKLSSKIETHNVLFNIKNLSLNNFSFDNNFHVTLNSSITVDKKKGVLAASGNICLKDKKIDLFVNAKDVNLNFLKIKDFTFGDSSLTLKINGSLNKNIASNLNFIVKNIKYAKWNNNIKIKKLNIISKFNFDKNNINIKNIDIYVDKNINFYGKGFIDNFSKFSLSFKSNTILTQFFNNFIPIENFTLSSNGKLLLNHLKLNGNIKRLKKINIKAKLSASNLTGKFREYYFSKLSFDANMLNDSVTVNNLSGDINNSKIKKLNLKFANNIISGNGRVLLNLTDLPHFDKELKIDKGNLALNISNIYIPLKNIKKLKFTGTYNISNTLLSYDFFKSIYIKTLEGEFNNNIIKVLNSNVTFRNINYSLNGYVKSFLQKPVKLNFNISANTFDKFIAQKVLHLNLGRCEHINAKVNLVGEIGDKFRLRLSKGNIQFFNSNVTFDKYKFKNINGSINLANKVVNINNINFFYNQGSYSVYGKIISPFQAHKIDLFVNANKIDKFITKLININEISNIKINAHLTGSFNDIKIASAAVKLNNTNIIYKNYKLNKISGNIFYENNLGNINISCYLNKIKYFITGQIINPFKGLEFSLNIKTDTIDEQFLKEAKLYFHNIKNIKADINIRGNLKNKLNFEFLNSNIKFYNSKIVFIKNKTKIKNVKGVININKNKIDFQNLRGSFAKGIIQLNGYLIIDKVKKGYFYIGGKNLDFNTEKTLKQKTKKIDKEKSKKKKSKLIETIYSFLKHIDIRLEANFENIKTEVNNFKKIYLNVNLNNYGIKVKNCSFNTVNNGYLLLKKGNLIFSTPYNIFEINLKYHNMNIGDILNFLMPKKSFELYGVANNCYINVSSKFKKLENFEKGLNGKFNIYYKNGFINKASLLASIFSILNIAQIFEFRLPDLNSKGFNYKELKGDFIIKNGVVSTSALKLKSNAFDMVYVGDIDLNKKIFNSTLAVYPLKTVDKILKYIPFIGYIFKDKNNKRGILVTYIDIKGTFDNPSIKLLPVKSITNKIGSMFKNLIELPVNIIKKPEDVIIPGGD